MKHARLDYNRIQDPENKIGEDEPVFLLRAKDMFAPQTVSAWADVIAANGNQELADIAYDWAVVMLEWQRKNGCKRPDMPMGDNIAKL